MRMGRAAQRSAAAAFAAAAARLDGVALVRDVHDDARRVVARPLVAVVAVRVPLRQVTSYKL